MKNYILNKEVHNDFMYVYSPICKAFKTFIAEKNCIHNEYNNDIKDWDYISVVTKEKYPSGCVAKTKCSFEKFGAPLIVFSNDITEDENGRLRYGHHYEVVAYEDGINIWSIDPDPSRTERPIAPIRIAYAEFPVEAGEVIELEVAIEGKKIVAKMLGHTIEATDDRIPAEFHIGITACEGINHFFELSIDNKN